MKKLILPFLFFASNPIFAQYLGGNGRGEITEIVLTKLLDGTTASATDIIFTISPINTMLPGTFSAAVQVVGSNNLRFNSSASIALAIGNNPGSGTLSGTTTVAASLGFAEFTGLSINNAGTGYTLTATSTGLSTATSSAFEIEGNRYAGGSGDGYTNNSVLNTPAGGQIIWRGGTSTDWATASNWYPVVVPSSTDAISIENNSFTNNPILDGNRTIASVDFGGAAKKIEVGSFNLTVSEVMFNADANNFVKTASYGVLKKSITNATSFTFPVGNANYNPVTIVNNNSASDVFSVKVRDEVLVKGTWGGQVADPHVNATWDISKTNANTGSGVDFVFQWASSQERNSIANFSLNHHNGTDWDFAANTSNSVTGSTTKIMNHYGYTGTFSPFAIGYQNTPLPLELLYFNAECKPQGVTALSWATASEINSAYFELQSSDDMLHWTILKTIPALGFHSSTYQYPEVLDSKPSQTTRYYRLKQVDLDGEYRYFQTLAAYCPFSGTSISLYPNPTAEHLHIQGAQAGVSWEIIDMTGRRILNGTINERPLQSISILGLPDGIYRLKLPTISLPFIIQ
jgi:hypothetical protein